jgi:DNA-binding CsgD family transcriptional regulator
VLQIKKYKEPICFGISLALLFFLLRWLEIHFLFFTHQYEIYVGIIAVLFTALGIWLAGELTKPKTIIVEKTVSILPFEVDENEIQLRKISKRELEVLSLIATGKSNQEIAAQLYVSLSTVKTHTANLFEKLDAKRRIQAIETAKRLHILP